MKFIEKYNNKKNIRFPFFKKTLEIALDRNLKILVETGTSRGKKKLFFFNKFNWKDGMSTLLFSEFAHNINGEIHSCDISSDNIKNAINFTKKFKNSVNFYIKDSVVFLNEFTKKIDLLYLDSYDGHNVELASKHQLNEAKACIDKLSTKSLILLDDKGAKTLYSTNFFIKNGFKIILESNNQLLFSK
jgi:hydroxymethylpyrimidine pyrophosphatase-like HAD family hydrolase